MTPQTNYAGHTVRNAARRGNVGRGCGRSERIVTGPRVLTAAAVIALAACGQRPVPPAPQGTTDVPATLRSYQCGEYLVSATFHGADSAELAFNGRALALLRSPAGPGVRYSDGHGTELWTRGEADATLVLPGENDRACGASQVKSQASLEVAGTARTTFDAIGNEPGWTAQVTLGDAPSLHVELDYGERKVEVAHAQQTGSGWRGTAADGTGIELAFQRTACQDSMSGEPFAATVTLRVAERSYAGCGGFSRD